MMKITDDVVDNAVLQIFADFKVPAGGRLLFSDLRLEWPKTRLRTSDLMQGIKRLTYRGLLELDDTQDGPIFILSPAAYERASQLPKGLRGTWNNFVSASLLGLARHRPDSAQPDGKRRLSDLQVANG